MAQGPEEVVFLAVHLGSQPSAPVCAGRLPGKDEAVSSFCAGEVELLQPRLCSALLASPLLSAVKACGFSDDPALATLQRAVVT